jgi:hypothetical protein
MVTSILTTKSTYRSLSTQRLSERTVFPNGTVQNVLLLYLFSENKTIRLKNASNFIQIYRVLTKTAIRKRWKEEERDSEV